MAGLLYAGFGYGRTSDLPGIWTSATAVEILSPPAGRFGGGCAAFSAADGSTLSKTVAFAGNVAVVGFAIKPTSVSVPASRSRSLSRRRRPSFNCRQRHRAPRCRAGRRDAARAAPSRSMTVLRRTPDPTRRHAEDHRPCRDADCCDRALITTTGTITEFSGAPDWRNGRLPRDRPLPARWRLSTPSVGSRVIDTRRSSTSASKVVDGYLLSTASGVDPATCRGHPPAAAHYTQINENCPTAASRTNRRTRLRSAPTRRLMDNTTRSRSSIRRKAGRLRPDAGGVNYQPLFAAQLVYALLVDAAHDDATVRVVDELPRPTMCISAH